MSEQSKSEKIKGELEQVRGLDSDGLLKPEAVVAWAKKNKTSAIYASLEWNDGAAAKKYRIEQARGLIRVVVQYVDHPPGKVRAYISTPTDRDTGGGYRPTDDALNRARQELVNEALAELRTFGNRFTHLPELAQVFRQVQDLADSYYSA